MADKEKKHLKSDLEALRNHTIKVNANTCEIFEVTCKFGHPVKPYQANNRLTCHKCEIDIEETFYRCSHNCNYDLCRRCAACP